MPARRFGRYRLAVAIAAMSLVGALLFGGATPAGAQNVVNVTTTAATGPGSLRAAFDTANSDAQETEIHLQDAETYVLACPGTHENLNRDGDLDHTEAFKLTILGNGSTIRQTCAGERVMHFTESTHHEIRDLTITGGDASGGGVFNQGGGVLSIGSVTFIDSTIIDNSATNSGGGVMAFALIGLVSTTVSDNEVTSDSGAGGGVYSTESVGGTNFTVVGNRTGPLGRGGGIFAGAEDGALVRLFHATITGNTSGTGANLYVIDGLQVASEFTLFATVISEPIGGQSCFASSTNSVGHNWDDDGSCGLADPTDHPDAGDPQLGPLQDNGGPTHTRLPAVGSSLIDDVPLGDCNGDIEDDQRHVTRPQRNGCDIGAVEVLPAVVVATTTTTTTEPPTQTPTAAPQAVAATPSFTG